MKRGRVIIVLMLTLALLVGCGQSLSDSFDEEEVMDKAERVVTILNEGDSEALLEMSSPELKAALTDETLEEIYGVINEAGEFKEIRDDNIAGDEDGETGEEYAVVSIKAEYKKGNFVYTITFNEDMELAGLYYK